ncbi:MAG TPA: dTDP-4-amino-4,6-dideoxygalactose transaminase [Candidatus Udaeobacter sp.]|jgi:dTDP-4-amino-4,6-dideoxygalactose transaminase|nr:dTDP-4-amino-4,6-dideoxygalactose transaminase [Candidatus Udaeobacter sp.]
MNKAIPFNKPYVSDAGRNYVAEALASENHSGDGPFTKRCHALLESVLGVPKVLLSTSCTHSLEMAALLLHLQPGDEVVVPSFTFSSTANAFALRGARIVFADIRRDTLNLDEQQVASLITPRTRTIVVVHYAGVGCEMDVLLPLAKGHGISVVEDNAHGLFGKYRGRYLGTFGTFASQSFHETKNFSCGEGGTLIINEKRFVEEAEVIREKGTNRSRFFRGEIDKYSWVGLGSSYLPSDILAALLLSQLEAREQIQAKRRQIWENYYAGLEKWAEQHGIALPFVPDHCEQTHHMFYLLLSSLQDQQALISHLRSHGVLAVFHYLPLHLSEYGRRLGGKKDDCPVTENVSARIVRLPFYFSLTEMEQAKIIELVCKFVPQTGH